VTHALASMCSRRISSTRACQPAPEARNAASTSGERRIETGTLVGVFWGPRLQVEIFWRNLEGSSSEVRAHANSSRVHSGFSWSLVCLTALLEFFSFTLSRLSQADRPNTVASPLREDQRIDPGIQEADRAESSLAVIRAVVHDIQGSFEVKFSALLREMPCFRLVALSFSGSYAIDGKT
jgi:hypothetical protein